MSVTLAECALHVVKYATQHHGKWQYPFVTHDRFMFHMTNMKERHALIGQANIFMRHHDNDANMSIDELRALAQDPAQSRELMNKMQRYAGNIRGTDGYFFARREELQHAVQQIGPLHLFLTFSQADNHWPDLHRLITVYDTSGHTHMYKQRIESVRKNPHIVDAWFSIRIELFWKHFVSGCLDAEWLWNRYEYQGRDAAHTHGKLKMRNGPDVERLVAKIWAGRFAERLIAAKQTAEQLLQFHGRDSIPVHCSRQHSAHVSMLALWMTLFNLSGGRAEKMANFRFCALTRD